MIAWSMQMPQWGMVYNKHTKAAMLLLSLATDCAHIQGSKFAVTWLIWLRSHVNTNNSGSNVSKCCKEYVKNKLQRWKFGKEPITAQSLVWVSWHWYLFISLYVLFKSIYGVCARELTKRCSSLICSLPKGCNRMNEEVITIGRTALFIWWSSN